MKKTLIIFLFFAMFSCAKKDTTNDDIIITDEIIEEKEVVLTPMQKFLEANGMNINASINQSDFLLLEDAVNKGLFKNKTFCEFYQEYKKLEYEKKYKEADKAISSLKKIKHLDILLAAKGNELCPEELKMAKSYDDYSTNKQNSSNKNYQSVDINPCDISKDFIKMDLKYPSTADFSAFDCSSEQNADGSYTVLRKVGAKNAFGVESEFVYKVTFGFTGGNEVDINDWVLIKIQSEEYR